MKTCNKCLELKDLDSFHKRDIYVYSRVETCKACCSLYKKEYYKANKDKIKQKVKEYQLSNLDFIKDNKIAYSKSNKVKLRKAKRLWQRLSRTTDINARLRSNLRARLNAALKGDFKTGSAVNDLGCSIQELKQHLESQFQPGMTWDNYGRYGWHIDHIIPLSAFNLQSQEQLIKACNYTNLQPLWAKDNIKKHNKIVGFLPNE